jgi:hypothetical protein
VSITGIITIYLNLRKVVVRGFLASYPVRRKTLGAIPSLGTIALSGSTSPSAAQFQELTSGSRSAGLKLCLAEFAKQARAGEASRQQNKGTGFGSRNRRWVTRPRRHASRSWNYGHA